MHGGGGSDSLALDNQLVDEITLLTYPVDVGEGTRLFPATGPRDRPGHSTRPGRLACHLQWGDYPGLPDHRPSLSTKGHASLEHVT